MEKTQHNLYCNKTKLDYQALLSTSKIAYSHCIEEIGRYMDELRSMQPSLLPYLTAQRLAREAEQLVIAAETMYTLEQGISREELVVVNKPPVKDF